MISRKAWTYVLTKSKKEKRDDVSVKTVPDFKDGVGKQKNQRDTINFQVQQLETSVVVDTVLKMGQAKT